MKLYSVRPKKWWSWAEWKKARLLAHMLNDPANRLQISLRAAVQETLEAGDGWNSLQERVSAIEDRWK